MRKAPRDGGASDSHTASDRSHLQGHDRFLLAIVRNHLAPGGLVYDPFLGSGTCLVAAETLGRRCLAVEIEPRYVQVSVERWQSLTGQQARRVDG